MARPTGDPFIDAVYDGIPTHPVNEVHRYVPDMVVAYGVPFEPETWRSSDPGISWCLQRDGSCIPCRVDPGVLRDAEVLWRNPRFQGERLGQDDQPKNVRNALIVLGMVVAMAIPAAAYVIYRERREH